MAISNRVKTQTNGGSLLITGTLHLIWTSAFSTACTRLSLRLKKFLFDYKLSPESFQQQHKHKYYKTRGNKYHPITNLWHIPKPLTLKSHRVRAQLSKRNYSIHLHYKYRPLVHSLLGNAPMQHVFTICRNCELK